MEVLCGTTSSYYEKQNDLRENWECPRSGNDLPMIILEPIHCLLECGEAHVPVKQDTKTSFLG